MEINNWLPMALNLKMRRVVVVGGGRVAARKLRQILPKAGTCVVISPIVASEVELWHAKGRLQWEARFFVASDVQRGDVIICTVSDETVRRLVQACAATQGAWYNDAVAASDGDFIVPSVLEFGRLCFSVMSGNASPRLIKLIKEDWQARYAALGKVADELAVFREEVKRKITSSQEREAFWQTYLPEDTLTRIEAGEWERMKGDIQDAISRLGAES